MDLAVPPDLTSEIMHCERATGEHILTTSRCGTLSIFEVIMKYVIEIYNFDINS